ncbi:MAG TPA: hypothetical protein VIY86_00485, partial [Pirellulaceae bacterium]
MRAMVVKLDPRIADVMVEHAKTSKPPVPTEGLGDRGPRGPRSFDRDSGPRESIRRREEPEMVAEDV